MPGSPKHSVPVQLINFLSDMGKLTGTCLGFAVRHLFPSLIMSTLSVTQIACLWGNEITDLLWVLLIKLGESKLTHLSSP